jgi:hypothetical protein
MSVGAQAACQCGVLWPAITERDCHVDPGALQESAGHVAESGPMSPVSRGRRKKRPTTRPRSARRVMPGLAGVHAELLDAFRPVVQATDPLEVEVLTSTTPTATHCRGWSPHGCTGPVSRRA